MYRYILASASPRRSELLNQVGIQFEIMKSDIEEIITNNEPDQVVIELSRQKAQDVYNNLVEKENVVVIGADTIVYNDSKILGKPKDEDEAFIMLTGLSGKSHYVYTGVTLIINGQISSFAEKTRVDVYSMTENEISEYIKTKEPLDKAGAYAIQGLFAAYIKGIEGDYNNVVGLPVGRICQELRQRGIHVNESIIGTNKKYKLCIFDLDGTISDSVGAIAHTANECLELFGLKSNPVEDYKMFAGEGQFELIKRALKAAGDSELKLYDQVMPKYIELFKTGCIYDVTSYPGVTEMLKAIKQKGIKIAILSNKHNDNTIKVVEEIFGKGFFDVILGQKDTHNRKPSPEGAYMIMEELKVKPEECLYVGDTGTDMETGSNAGIETIGVTWGFRSREELISAKATYIVDEPKEILDLL